MLNCWCASRMLKLCATNWRATATPAGHKAMKENPDQHNPKKLLFTGGEAYLPQGLAQTEVLVEGDRIAKIGPTLKEDMQGDTSVRIIDLASKLLLPGVIDSQVHFRWPGGGHKEDIGSGSRAAALGGITTFLEMPNTNPPTTNHQALHDKLAFAEQNSVTNYGFFMGATGDNLEDLKELQGHPGACGIKIFLGSSTGDLLLYEPAKLRAILENTWVAISCHSEDEELLQKRRHLRDTGQTAHAHLEWRNEETAFSCTRKLLHLARECGRKVHVLHITSKAEIEFLAGMKDFCTVEVTPQHLTLEAPDCYDRLGTFAQMNPPIRGGEHRRALWQAVRDGTVDVIGSDHAPHTREEKERGYPHSPSGMPGVQTLLPLLLDAVNRGDLELARLVELVCTGPAKLFRLEGKGAIRPGFHADLTVVDMERNHTITDAEQASRVGWTPFAGHKVQGMPVMTVVNGVVVMEDGQLTGVRSGRAIQVSK